MRFEFDDGALRELVSERVGQLAGELQRAFVDVYDAHRGQSVDGIKPVLVQRLSEVDGASPPADLELTEYYSTIANNTPVVVFQLDGN